MSNLSVQTKKEALVTEVLNAITHGIGTLLSVIALIFLIMKGIQSGNTAHLAAYLVFGISMILLFLASTLYHSFSFTRFKNIFHYIDHASIYLLIAGSYTPFCLIVLDGKPALLLFITVWSIALAGVILKVFFVGKYGGLSTFLYLVMGWLAIFLIKPIGAYLGPAGLTLLISGGLAYSLGTIFYSIKRFKFMHVIWHIFVIMGAGFIYFTILLYI